MRRTVSLIYSFILVILSLFILSPVYSVKSEGTNLIINGDFSDVSEKKVGKKTIYTLNQWGYIGFSLIVSGESKYVKTSSESGDHTLSPTATVSLNAGVYKLNLDAMVNGNADISFRLDSDIYVNETISGQGTFDTYEFTFTLEESDNYWLTFYVSNFTEDVSLDNLGLYYLGEGVAEREPETFDDENVLTEWGASIRAHDTTSGLRFKGRVNKAFFDDIVAAYPDAEAGMIIAPTDFLDDCEFTVSALTKAKAVQICTVDRWNNEQTVETDNYYGFNCAIVNVLPYNIDRRFSARSFVRFTENGNVKYIYGSYEEADNARSIKYVAEEALKEAHIYADYQITAMRYFLDTIYYPEETSVSATNGVYVFDYSGITGYFVLDYDRQAYTVSVNSFKVNGTETDFSYGMVLISESADIEISFSISASGEIDGCPVKGKIYRNR